MKWCAVKLGLVLLLLSPIHGGQNPTDAAIDKLIQAFGAAEGHRDGKRLSELFSADGEIFSDGKILAAGREQISKSLAEREPWSERFGPVYRLERVRSIKTDVAIADARKTVLGAVFTQAGAARFVMVKEGADWRIVSYSECGSVAFDHPFERLKGKAH